MNRSDPSADEAPLPPVQAAPSAEAPFPAGGERSACPVACVLDLVGDRWTLLVVRDLLRGKRSFEEFAASPERIATNILAARLKQLVEAGLVERRSDAADRRRVFYQLTPAGERLRSLVKAIAAWGLRHIPGTAVPADAVVSSLDDGSSEPSVGSSGASDRASPPPATGPTPTGGPNEVGAAAASSAEGGSHRSGAAERGGERALERLPTLDDG